MHPVHVGIPNSFSVTCFAHSAKSNYKFILLLHILPQSIVDYSRVIIKSVTDSLHVGLHKK